MDIAAFLRSLSPVDIILVILFACAFAVGYIEGAARALIASLAWVFSFLVAANLRGPLGDRLAVYWTQFGLDYTLMLAFLLVYVLAVVVCGVIIASLTKRQPLLADSRVLDPLLGGAIALVVSVLLLAGVIAGLETVYRFGLAFNDVPLLANVHELLANSVIGHWIEATVVPIVTTVTGPLLPDEFARLIRA
jgi:uncharacterized membrane protein required for colicin V production